MTRRDKRLDYNKNTNYRFTSPKTAAGNRNEVTNLHNIPTQEMIRFNRFLVKLCHENGIDEAFEYDREDRDELYKLNNTLSRKLTMAGVQYKDLWHSKKKFKFDKDGNVVDAWTGKIVRKRGQNGSD